MATANPFDQFDEVAADVAATPAPETNPFDQFDTDEDKNLGSNSNNPSAEQSYLTRISDALTADRAVDTSNVPEDIAARFGDTAGRELGAKAQDVVSDTLVTGAETIFNGGLAMARAILPDDWEEAIVDTSRNAWTRAMSNSTFREGIEYLKEGKASYDGWAKENPEASKRLEEIVNVGAVGAGKVPGVKTGTNFGESVVRSADINLKNNRRAQISELLEPPAGKGQGHYEIVNGKKTYMPSEWEKDVAREVARVGDVNLRKPVTTNVNHIRDKSMKLREELDGYIIGRGNPEVDMNKIQVGLANKLNTLDSKSLLVGDAMTSAQKVFNVAQDVLAEHADGTALGLMNARRQLDAELKRQAPNLFDANVSNGVLLATRIIREDLNEQVAKALKSKKTKDLLQRQHKLLTAADMLDAKVLKEADTRIGRIIQKIEAKTGTKIPTTPVAQAAIGTTAAAGAAAIGGIPAVGALGALFSAYKGGRWLFSPKGKRWLGQVIQVIESDAFLMETLGTDRAALLTLLNHEDKPNE